MSKTLKFLQDKGFVTKGEVHTYSDDLAESLIEGGYAEEFKSKAKTKTPRKLFNKDKEGDK